MTQPTSRLLPPCPASVPDDSPDLLAEAYERVRGDLEALSPREVVSVRAPVDFAVMTVFGALPNIEALLPEMREALPKLDFGAIGRLPDYARALLFTDQRARRASKAPPELPALLAEALPLRERLLSAAELLATYGAVSGGRVAAIRRGTGRLDAATDLMALAALFREGGPELVGRTPASDEEVARAGQLAASLLEAIGRRAVGTDDASRPSPFADERNRAFCVLLRAYDEARRAIAFLRWREGDADALAPSIFARPRRRRRGAPE
ncbi:MAG TPA: hypothetical protein VFS43_19390 [Polyangiaceae bacterium]|nr:hypothetical protein [Polyangiaceae bacterium]